RYYVWCHQRHTPAPRRNGGAQSTSRGGPRARGNTAPRGRHCLDAHHLRPGLCRARDRLAPRAQAELLRRVDAGEPEVWGRSVRRPRWARAGHPVAGLRARAARG
ncbi:hypothetical protein M885DRAFT_622160, partial [Pelagophyceae sp. CCMP2097]